MHTTINITAFRYHQNIGRFGYQEVFTAKYLRDRRMRRALLPFFKPENSFEVHEALMKAGRLDLIGLGCETSIPANPPRAALRARMEKVNRALDEGRYVYTVPQVSEPAKLRPEMPPAAAGYRPARKTARRRPRR